MREAIGGTWIFQIVIFFILLFTGYMCLSINHSKAFNVKNSIINVIERKGDNGINLNNPEHDEAIQQIVKYLKETSYRTTGKCPDGNYHGFNREGKIDNSNPAFCIEPVDVATSSDLPSMTYYRIVVFYQLDLPIFRSVFQFRVTGDTKIISRSTEVHEV